jgi:hypothetical protein
MRFPTYPHHTQSWRQAGRAKRSIRRGYSPPRAESHPGRSELFTLTTPVPGESTRRLGSGQNSSNGNYCNTSVILYIIFSLTILDLHAGSV